MRAVTFDFYETLVRPRAGAGRGRRFREYLASVDLAAEPWEHQVLYDVFEFYGEAYCTDYGARRKDEFWIEFTRRLFERTGVKATVNPASHAQAVRQIFGPEAFELFDDVLEVMQELRARGLKLAVISDWQAGLKPFCEELGLAGLLDSVIASADVGFEKPDRRLFDVARAQLDVPAEAILHVGDQAVDVDGAHAAGFRALRIDRAGGGDSPRVIRSLREL